MRQPLLIPLLGTFVIAGAAAPAPAVGAPSPCAQLGGTIESNQTCHVRSETRTYAVDFSLPVDYPDMQPVVDFLEKRRDAFAEGADARSASSMRNELDIVGHAYQSATTRTLVLDIGSDSGIHPVTTFKAFSYDVDKRAPITLGTLLEASAQPLAVLNANTQRALDKRGSADLSSKDLGVDAYQNFAITDESVIFFIDQDGAFPHDIGALEVPVPKAELAPLMAGSDALVPCASGQVTVTAEPPQAAVTHRRVTLTFGLAPGAAPCTITGYPGVDTGGGGPLVHAQRTARGYMGGLPGGVDQAPTTMLSPSTSAHAVVEGMAVDEAGSQCPTYTDLLVTPPDTTQSSKVSTTIDTCALQVHPITG